MPKTKTSEPVDKIAVDTAIWLKALLFGGSAEELIKMAVTGKVEILTTEAQFEDLKQVLQNRLNFSDTAVAEVRTFMETATTLVKTPEEPAAGPGERLSPLLRAARHSKVSAIATSDGARFAGIEDFEGIPIVTVS